MKYAVKIRLSDADWIYVTKDTDRHCWDLQPETFASKLDAELFADKWRKTYRDTSYIKVVNYEE